MLAQEVNYIPYFMEGNTRHLALGSKHQVSVGSVSFRFICFSLKKSKEDGGVWVHSMWGRVTVSSFTSTEAS